MARSSFIPQRGKTLRDCLEEYFAHSKTEQMPPLHVTDQEALAQIRKTGSWQPPAGGGASFSHSNTLRLGDVALRIKPGSERWVELTASTEAFGLVPRFWPQGVGTGNFKTYIPIEHLQFFNPLVSPQAPFGHWSDVASLPR